MTPQEKAKEIYDAFLKEMGHHLSKQCALIAADVTLNYIKNVEAYDYEFQQMRENYFEEVKQEIEKL